MRFAGDVRCTADEVKLSGSKRKGLQIDRALETLVELRAEGESVLYANLSGKRTKIISFSGFLLCF